MRNRVKTVLGLTFAMLLLAMNANASFSDNEENSEGDKSTTSSKGKEDEEENKLYREFDSSSYYVKVSSYTPEKNKVFDKERRIYTCLIATNDAIIEGIKEKVKKIATLDKQLEHLSSRNFLIIPMAFNPDISAQQFIEIRNEMNTENKPQQSATSRYLLKEGDIVRFAVEINLPPEKMSAKKSIKPFSNFRLLIEDSSTTFGSYCHTIKYIWGKEFSDEWGLKK